MFASRNSNTTDSNFKIVELLLKSGSEPNFQTNSGYTALILACLHSSSDSSLETAKILLDYGAKINIQNYEGNTALSIAIMNYDTTSSFDTIKLLLDHGADVNIQSIIGGNTPLMMIAGRKTGFRNLEIVQMLLERGANPYLMNKNNETAFSLAANNIQAPNIFEIVNLLSNVTTDITYINTKDLISLISTKNPMAIKIVQRFIDRGVQPLKGTPFFHKVCEDDKLYKFFRQKIALEYIKYNILSSIKSTHAKRWYQPENLRSKLIAINFELNNGKVNESYEKNKDLRDYFGIADSEMFRLKISENVKYMD